MPSIYRFVFGILAGLLSVSPTSEGWVGHERAAAPCAEAKANAEANFLVMAGGGAPSYNEIALEKNVLYFQRSLQTMGFDPAAAQIFFANGNDGAATVRYLNPAGQELFKTPEIPHLQGASTLENFQGWLAKTLETDDRRPVFFYFTGHGYHNRRNENNNAMILWGEEFFSVQQLTRRFDQLPRQTTVVTMMSQCYAGAFANLIYQEGDPNRAIAVQTRCGFFATIKSRPSVGCTPEVDEADYQDYSSSFFAGLTGKSRTGQAVASADYNDDGRVSYTEAHAFAKVDEQTTDLPVSSLEVWLQEQATDQQAILETAIVTLVDQASADRQYVVEALVEKFQLDPDQSFVDNFEQLPAYAKDTEVEQAYLTRLRMELINIAMEQQIRDRGDKRSRSILDRLEKCEGGSW